MRRLVLVRHSKASHDAVTDLERPLTPKGTALAGLLAKELRKRLETTDLLLVSPAARARETARPIRDLAWLQADVTFEYDNGVPENTAARITELLRRPELVIQKRTKRKDLADVDIAPMIREVFFTEGEGIVTGTVTVQAQNPGLNPQLLEKAVARYLPDLTPDFTRIRRRAILDAEGRDFR